MSEPVLLMEKSEGVTTLTLNRPGNMNALSRELRMSLNQTFEELNGDPETKAVILTGAGRAFCAGVDLKELSGAASFGDAEEGLPGEKMAQLLDQFDRPIIGAINGVAITGGFELALACDILIASSEARFADTHGRVGLLPGWGLSQKLPRIIGMARAKEMSFTGNYISASQAEAWGLVNRVVRPDELMPVCLGMAKEITSCVPETIREYKRLINQGCATTLSQGMELEAEAYAEQARNFSAKAIASRREGIFKRGRDQKEG
ncbi:MAG: enoyl-CoA hydratase [Thermodesulfobacteriota bacterium]|nr:enoyl-CoA hydratase [Thermodesulfobacteriota bacterium]